MRKILKDCNIEDSFFKKTWQAPLNLILEIGKLVQPAIYLYLQCNIFSDSVVDRRTTFILQTETLRFKSWQKFLHSPLTCRPCKVRNATQQNVK